MRYFRHLHHFEADLYRDHLLRLDPDSRYARFTGTLPDASIRSYVNSIDWSKSELIGCFSDNLIRGAVEIRYSATNVSSEAELAFSVEKEFQNTRVGTHLMDKSLILLQNRQIKTAHIVCLLSNKRMQKLALRHRANVRSYSGDVFMTISVPNRTWDTVASELTDSYFAWLRWGIEWASKTPSLSFQT